MRHAVSVVELPLKVVEVKPDLLQAFKAHCGSRSGSETPPFQLLGALLAGRAVASQCPRYTALRRAPLTYFGLVNHAFARRRQCPKTIAAPFNPEFSGSQDQI